MLVAGLVLDVLSVYESFQAALRQFQTTVNIVGAIAPDFEIFTKAFYELDGYCFKDYVKDKERQFDKGIQVYSDFIEDVEDMKESVEAQFYASIAAVFADMASVVSLLVPSEATPCIVLGSTIVSTWSSAITSAMALKNMLEIESDWDDFYEEVQKPVGRKDDNTPSGDNNPRRERPGGSSGSGGGGVKTPSSPMIDPAGYVYEAVASNRVEGATARVYYLDSETDAETYWAEAEYYGEVNPQITDETGEFSWYTPIGRWKVRVEKDGYLPADSEADPAAVDGWLPVPPPQLSVYIPMVSTAAPTVESAAVASNVAVVIFSQYMDIAKLNGLLGVTQDGQAVEVEFAFSDAEESPTEEGVFYGRRLEITRADGEPFTGNNVRISVDGSFVNYAGTPLGTAYSSGALTVKRMVGSIDHGYATRYLSDAGEEKEIAIEVRDTVGDRLPGVTVAADALYGRFSVTPSAVTDENGVALFTLRGISTGNDTVAFTAEDVSVELAARVDMTAVEPAYTVSGAVSGSMLTYTVEGAPSGALLIAARYDGGRMTWVQTVSSPEMTDTLRAGGSGGQFRLFLLDGNDLCPLCPVWSN